MLKADTALEAIRKTICVTCISGETVLHETDLAQEYGMSRTPIRQILQRLSYERLVTTKSGVGTVVTPLLAEHRARDLKSLRALALAACMLEMPVLSVSQHSDVIALSGFAQALQPDDSEMQYELMSRLHGLLVGLISDPIIADAFSASFWRVVRWHMAANAEDPQAACTRLAEMTAALVHYQDRASADLFSRLADNLPV